ncbi:hypothetical protein BOTBODRAFT_177807 [Botryobasidium botryosum FD-172 SS1]|uniref:Uncharacterized protein n=1 Tax=Botryobasidium botryosum (strain FD-172 SS1) TaxID=930990 RepID=A0A067M583_BOTB1|nr:hypothetical protein BOTBODRAFT_177807 [Botryobasidium botryosum FD-172 SS1]
MSDKTSVFYEVPTLFPQLIIYANAVNDISVPYVTSAIELWDNFATYETNGIDIKLDAEYGPLIVFRGIRYPTTTAPTATSLLKRLFPLNISRASRKRVQLLESDKSWSANWLSAIFHELEREVGDAVSEFIDYPDDGNPTAPTPAPLEDMSQLIILQAQREIVAPLNALPNLRERLAFIHPVRSSHATIICRDEKQFESHKIGRGMLRCWKDNFRL